MYIEEIRIVKMLVTDVVFEIVEDGFSYDFDSNGNPAISITAITPNGKQCDCYWWYKERGKGVYRFNDLAYDKGNGGHVRFCKWLQKYADCNEEEAIKAMKIILKKINKRDQYFDNELHEKYLDAGTDIIIDSGIILDDRAGRVCKTTNGKYIGAITCKGELETLVYIVKEEVDDLYHKIKDYQYNDVDRTAVIIDAVERAAGLKD